MSFENSSSPLGDLFSVQPFLKRVRGDSRVAKWDRLKVGNKQEKILESEMIRWGIYWLSAFVGSNPTPRIFYKKCSKSDEDHENVTSSNISVALATFFWRDFSQKSQVYPTPRTFFLLKIQ